MITLRVEYSKEYREWMYVTSRSGNLTVEFVRPLNYKLFEETHLPELYQVRLGALVAVLFRIVDVAVSDVEIHGDNGDWTAEAGVEFYDCRRLCRGQGATPIEAFINLILDIQRY